MRLSGLGQVLLLASAGWRLRALQAFTLARLPQIRISHQSRSCLGDESRKTKSQASPPHIFVRASSGEVARATKASTMSKIGARKAIAGAIRRLAPVSDQSSFQEAPDSANRASSHAVAGFEGQAAWARSRRTA